jgi:hypothetical protein
MEPHHGEERQGLYGKHDVGGGQFNIPQTPYHLYEECDGEYFQKELGPAGRAIAHKAPEKSSIKGLSGPGPEFLPGCLCKGRYPQKQNDQSVRRYGGHGPPAVCTTITTRVSPRPVKKEAIAEPSPTSPAPRVSMEK